MSAVLVRVSKGAAGDELRMAVQHMHRSARLLKTNRRLAKITRQPGDDLYHRIEGKVGIRGTNMAAGAFIGGGTGYVQGATASHRRGAGSGGVTVSKDVSQPKASLGREVTGTVFGGAHSLVAGKKGKKLSAWKTSFGRAWGGGITSSLAGAGIAAALHKNPVRGAQLGSPVGSILGANSALRHNQALGRYKPQPVSKDWAIPFHSSQIQARNPLGRFAVTGTKPTIIDHGDAHKMPGCAKVGHGKSTLAPVEARRARVRPASSNAPDAAGYGRRLHDDPHKHR